MKLRPAIVDTAPLTIIGSSRLSARRRWMAMPSWIAPETAAQAPKATKVAPASEPNAAIAIQTTASALTAALIRSTRASEKVDPRDHVDERIGGKKERGRGGQAGVGGRHVVADGQHHRRRPDQGEDGSYDGETLRRDPQRSAALGVIDVKGC